MFLQLKPFFVRFLPIVCLSLFTSFLLVASADAQSTLSTAIPYQGQLSDGGNPATGQYDFEFKLFDATTAGSQIGSTNSKENVQVSSGSFAVELDFGGSAFTGAGRFLEIGVRAGNSTGAFTTLTPRRPLLAVPYALYSPSGAKPAYGTAANAPNDAAYVASNGNVGIGTTNPQTKLHIDGSMTTSGISLAGPNVAFLSSTRGDGGRAIMHDNGDVLRINYNGELGGGTSIGTGVAVYGPLRVAGSDFTFLPNGNGAGGRALVHDANNVLRINYNGELGGGTSIGTGLAVYGPIHLTGPDLVFLPFGTNGDGGQALGHDANDTLAVNYGGGFSGGVRVDSKLAAKTIQITGGADIAEPFAMSDSSKIEPGMVVAIDPDHPGQLRLAQSAYDRMVAGVVSGAGGVNSGLIMQQEGTAAAGEHPVALTGRVYVWVDADKTPVNPGDLLTTSATPGHAMKVTDHNKAQGAILGKAMGTLEQGKGLVLMLVSLQ
jgi:hypothetical protein